MLKQRLLGTVHRSNLYFSAVVGADKHGGGLPSLLRESSRCFSTGAEQQQPPNNRPVPDSFLETPATGLVYGKLSGIFISRNTLKTDIVNMLDGSNLTMEDVRVDYNRSFHPLAMMVQFRSHQAYDQALKVISRMGRLNKLERADRSQWDILTPYNGRAILLQGIPRNAVQEDVERFLSGFQYDASSIQIFLRAALTGPVKMATIRFPSQTEAMTAFITKNRAFCLNEQVTVCVLQ